MVQFLPSGEVITGCNDRSSQSRRNKYSMSSMSTCSKARKQAGHEQEVSKWKLRSFAEKDSWENKEFPAGKTVEGKRALCGLLVTTCTYHHTSRPSSLMFLLKLEALHTGESVRLGQTRLLMSQLVCFECTSPLTKNMQCKSIGSFGMKIACMLLLLANNRLCFVYTVPL